MRFGFTSCVKALTRKTVSTFAATTCSSTARPAALRDSVLRRSKRR